jgi:hypothetical protein
VPINQQGKNLLSRFPTCAAAGRLVAAGRPCHTDPPSAQNPVTESPAMPCSTTTWPTKCRAGLAATATAAAVAAVALALAAVLGLVRLPAAALLRL